MNSLNRDIDNLPYLLPKLEFVLDLIEKNYLTVFIFILIICIIFISGLLFSQSEELKSILIRSTTCIIVTFVIISSIIYLKDYLKDYLNNVFH